MAAGVFRFKRFEVRNERSAMKVNTDGVLLGAAVQLPGNRQSTNSDTSATSQASSGGIFEVLDAGTGTGTIALMIAQRLADARVEFHVTGIDIDEASAQEAGENFENSPWSRNMTAAHIPLCKSQGLFDLIVSNPPYYDDSLQNPDGRKNTARHTVAADEEGLEGAPMSWRTLLEFASVHLKEHGTMALVLPADQEASLLRYARMYGFSPTFLIRIHTTERKPAARIVVQLGRGHKQVLHNKSEPSAFAEGSDTYRINQLIIQCSGDYTDEYRLLMKEFYLWA